MQFRPMKSGLNSTHRVAVLDPASDFGVAQHRVPHHSAGTTGSGAATRRSQFNVPRCSPDLTAGVRLQSLGLASLGTVSGSRPTSPEDLLLVCEHYLDRALFPPAPSLLSLPSPEGSLSRLATDFEGLRGQERAWSSARQAETALSLEVASVEEFDSPIVDAQGLGGLCGPGRHRAGGTQLLAHIIRTREAHPQVIIQSHKERTNKEMLVLTGEAWSFQRYVENHVLSHCAIFRTSSCPGCAHGVLGRREAPGQRESPTPC